MMEQFSVSPCQMINAVLVFSHVGYIRQEVAVRGRKHIEVRLVLGFPVVRQHHRGMDMEGRRNKAW